MVYDATIELFGLIAGAVTSFGFIPQLIKGFRTKQLDDISTYMPLILAFGMTLWFIYGILQSALAVIIANIFGVGCCMILIYMKRSYSKLK
jgi:MtN3 and saliva related transmembrane protein